MSALDLFSIAFQSEGLKDFETELKRNEAELDKYEKILSETESAMKKMADEGKAGSAEYKKLETRLSEAKNQVQIFSKSVTALKGTPQAALLEFKSKFSSLAMTVAKIAAVGIAIKKALNFAEQGQQLDWLAQKAGTTVEKLSAIGQAAQTQGGTTEGTAATMANLRSQYQSMMMGEGGGGLEQAAFKYGVTLSSDPEKMLENVAKRMESLKSDAAKWDLAETLGIDEGTARLLMKGLDGYKQSVKDASKYKLYTQDDINRMREYNQVSSDIRMGVESIFGSIYRALLPVILQVSKAIRGITDWLATHSGATKIIGTIAAVAAAIYTVITAVKFLNAAFLLLGANPIVLIIAGIVLAVAALIAIIQDLYSWFTGGESVIGDFCNFIVNGFKEAWEWVKEIWGDVTEWFSEKIDSLKEIFSTIADFIADIWNGIGDGIKSFFSSVINWIKEKIYAVLDFLPDKVKEWLGLDTVSVDATTHPAVPSNQISAGQRMLAYNNQLPLNSVPSGSLANYYSTQSQNQTSIDNARSFSKSNSLVVQNMTVETQAQNAQDFYNGLSTMTAFDNGMQ